MATRCHLIQPGKKIVITGYSFAYGLEVGLGWKMKCGNANHMVLISFRDPYVPCEQRSQDLFTSKTHHMQELQMSQPLSESQYFPKYQVTVHWSQCIVELSHDGNQLRIIFSFHTVGEDKETRLNGWMWFWCYWILSFSRQMVMSFWAIPNNIGLIFPVAAWYSMMYRSLKGGRYNGCSAEMIKG